MSTEPKVVDMDLHKEFAGHMDDLHREMDRRISALENNIDTLHEISTSVAKLATAMETMNTEQREQRDEIREIHANVMAINVTNIECTLDNHETRIRDLELKPQDSEDHEKRLRDLEGKPAKHWEKIVTGVIAGVVAFLVGMACQHMWGG